MLGVWCVVWRLWYVYGVYGDRTYSDAFYCHQYIPSDILGQYIPVNQQVHRNTTINTSTFNNANVEVLSEGGK